jgi:hypothetical protein
MIAWTLVEAENAIRLKARGFMERAVQPIIGEKDGRRPAIGQSPLHARRTCRICYKRDRVQDRERAILARKRSSRPE